MKQYRTIFFIIAVVSVAAIGFVIVGENQISFQKEQIASLQQTVKKNNNQIASLTKKNASESAQIIALLNQPTPTPAIVYKTNTVTNTQYVAVPGQTVYQSKPATPVTYLQAGNLLLGNNGSTCMTIGNELSCTGGR